MHCSVIAFVVSLASPTGIDARRDIEPRVRRAAREAPTQMHAALVRLPPGDPWSIAALEALGVRFRPGRDGRPRHVGSVHPIDAPGAVLGELAELGWHVRIGAPNDVLTTNVTGAEIGTWSAQAHGPVPFAGPTGREITIADLDSAIDLFHPHLFHADAGAHPWVDVDGDGVLTAGVDGIDTDVDGEIAANEVLVLMDYAWWRPIGGGEREYHGPDGAFDPAFDYLFVDFDGDAERDYGAMQGYEESTPGYGEPMFVPDDANGDGEIDVHERILMLGTSRIAAYRRGSEVWHRGEDLVAAAQDLVDYAYHATAVAGILVGGQDRLFRAHRGLLPDADLLVSAAAFYDTTEADTIESIAWGVEEGADIVMYEFGRWRGIELDGTRSLDIAVSESVASGIPHVCPAGNLADAGKHAQSTAQPVSFPFDAPLAYGNTVFPGFTLDLHWRDTSTELTCTLRDPDDAELVVVPGGEQSLGAATITSERFDTPAGTAILMLEIDGPGQNHPNPGAWSIECTHDATDLLVHAYLYDYVSSWERGVQFADDEPTTTMTSPSTADGCFTTANYQFQNPYAVEAGELDVRSGRGPRMDGRRSVDIAAPSDAYAPYAQTDGFEAGSRPGLFQNNYRIFSGTSGAAPHVTASVAQLLELEPALAPAEMIQRFTDAAATDELTGTALPDDGWGHGKLRVVEALYGDAPATQPEYVARDLEVEFEPGADECSIVVRVPDADWPDPSFRWDDEYDGAWDSEFEAAAERVLVVDPETTSFAVRVEYGQAGWRVGGAAITGEVPPSCFGGVADTSGSATDDDDDGDGPDSGSGDDGPDDPPTSSGGTDSTAGADDSSDGCGCTAPARGSGWGLLVLFAAVRFTRRRD
jgi:hypothetical protein